MKRIGYAIFFFLLGAALWYVQILAAGDPREELMEVDRQFAAATERHGVDGFVSYLAPGDLLKFQDKGAPLTEPAAVRRAMAPAFAQPGFRLRWQPVKADVSGGLGYTYGTWRITAPSSARTGHYITVWKRQSGGAWKVVVDAGNPD